MEETQVELVCEKLTVKICKDLSASCTDEEKLHMILDSVSQAVDNFSEGKIGFLHAQLEDLSTELRTYVHKLKEILESIEAPANEMECFWKLKTAVWNTRKKWADIQRDFMDYVRFWDVFRKLLLSVCNRPIQLNDSHQKIEETIVQSILILDLVGEILKYVNCPYEQEKAADGSERVPPMAQTVVVFTSENPKVETRGRRFFSCCCCDGIVESSVGAERNALAVMEHISDTKSQTIIDEIKNEVCC